MDGFLDRYIGARFYYIWYTLRLPPHCDWGIIYCISTFLMTHSVSLCKERRLRWRRCARCGARQTSRSHPCLSKLEKRTLCLDTTSQRNKRPEHVSRVITLQKTHYVQVNHFQRATFVYHLPSKNLNGNST